MADSKIGLEISVDGNAEAQIKRVADAVKSLEAKGGQSLENFGDISKKAFDVFTKGAVILGSVEAVKKALDLTFEAETVRATSVQFELLAKNAGISGEALKEGLAAASDGLIDDTDLIKIANQAIIEMGESAGKLPPVMDLARKATSIFGGDLATNFEAISHAIATGQTRALKNFGIIIDQKQAYDAFALSIGTTAESLSEAGKQQAILNAVLSQGESKFAGVNVNLKEGTDTFQRLKVTLSQIGETATLAFEALAGEKVRSILNFTADAAKNLNRAMVASFGEGKEKVQANVDQLTAKINELKVKLIDLEQKKLGHVFDFTPGDTASKISAITATLQQYEADLSKSQTELAKLNEKHAETTVKNTEAAKSFVDLTEAQRKLADEGQKVAERLQGEDPNAKYEKELEALSTYLVRKSEITDADAALLDQLEIDRDAKIQEKRDREIDDLIARNDAMKAIDSERFASEISANEAKLSTLRAQGDQFSARELARKKREADEEVRIKILTANSVSGILGNMATVAKEFGEEGFAVFQALAKAQALVNTYSSAVAAYNSAASIPVVGAALAPIAAAAAIAAGLAQVAQINRTHLAGGIDSVPAGFERDNFPAYLQSGERVVPKETNRDLKAFLNGNGPMVALLQSIDSKLSNLQPQLYIDGREVFGAIRNQLNSGRSFT